MRSDRRRAAVWAMALAAALAAGSSHSAEPRAETGAASEKVFVLPTPDEVPVWHPRETGCFEHELADSDRRWDDRRPGAVLATSPSSLRFWRVHDNGADVLVMDGGHFASDSTERTPFVVVASGKLWSSCVERLEPSACPEAARIEDALLAWRIPVGDAVPRQGNQLPIQLHVTYYRIEVADRLGTRNRWTIHPGHEDYDAIRQQFDAADRCFSRVRGAISRWKPGPGVPAPEL